MKKRFTIIEKLCGLAMLVLILRLIVPAWALEFQVDKNAAFNFTAPLINSTNTSLFATGANNTLFYTHSNDNTIFAQAATNITIIGTSGVYLWQLNQTEMNHNRIGIYYNGTGCLQQYFVINTLPKETIDAVQTQTDKMTFTVANKIDSNVYTWNGTAVSNPATAGIPDVNMKNIANVAVSTSAAQIGVNAVQIGAAVPGSATIGTVTNLTNAPTNGDLTATMKTSVTTAATSSTPALSAAGVDAIWEEVASGHTTTGTFGKYLDKQLTLFNDITAASVWSVATRLLTAGTNIVLAKGTGITGFNDITAANVWDTNISAYSGAGYAGTYLKGIFDKLPTNYIMGSAVLTGKDDEMDAILADTAAMDTSTELRTLLTGSDTAVSTYAGADTSGTTTLLTRLSAARAGYLDSLNGMIAQTGDAYAIVNNGTYGNSALNTAIATRLATSGYTAPDNTNITNIINLLRNGTGYATCPTNKSIWDYIDAAISSRSTYAGGPVASVTGNVGGNVTGSVGSISGITFPTNFGVLSISATTGLVDITQAAADKVWGTTARALTDKVNFTLASGEYTNIWNKDISGYTEAGYAGTYLKGAGAAGDPWVTVLPGAYTSGQAGYIIGHNIDALISSRGTSTLDAAGVWAYATRLLTAGTNIVLAKGVGITGFNDIAATDVWAAATRQLTGTQTFNLTGNITGNLSGSIGSLITWEKTGYALSAAGVDAILDELLSGHSTEGSVGKKINDIPTSGTGDWTANEATEIKTILGVTGTGTPDDTPSDGSIKEIQDKMPTPYDVGP